MTDSSTLTLTSLTKTYGSHKAVDGVDLFVGNGEFLSLLGPSGCGKTSLLRLIAGFIQPDHGRIHCGGDDITELPPYSRNLGVVFQNYALFPHMTAAENVGYGLKIRRVPRASAQERITRALDRVGLQNAGGRYPSQLSGGMQQRVALARALVIEPKILLLDEPLSALDKHLREDMQVELRLLQQRIGVTTIFVTHDQEEAMTLSNRVAVMQGGRVQQIGTPNEVYLQPSNKFVATFLGTTNLMQSKVLSSAGSEVTVMIDGWAAQVSDTGAVNPGDEVQIAVRPENLLITREGNGIAGTISDIIFQGHRLIVLFTSHEGKELRSFTSPSPLGFSKGDAVVARFASDHASVLSA
ncbi:ABC transporter ATP-binding protein [Aureimonas fodinaquatilis]|uniref:Spermidine/putrescine import ATP-binding protein PotA n=1 Tax=Aureimonas fodinaquatilis TaxID=2565783 RepID=A0A5B0DVJ7_9HYPH|nr:ABC transporter ATP-binding protein [Aureimonas fodinaquatilis]KAA0970764.1 ABC transporter ATP-binding protein [Aureimonas fodinaquatilis]